MSYLDERRKHIQSGRPLPPKKTYKINSKSEKRIAKEKEQREAVGDDALDKWFEERRKEMTGKCCLCGGKSEKGNDDTYRRSIHHLFEKRPIMFPSVSCHPDNWLELCFWTNSCHQNIHNGTITMELLHDSAEWAMIVEKAKSVFPSIHPDEHKNIHPLLLKELIHNP